MKNILYNWFLIHITDGSFLSTYRRRVRSTRYLNYITPDTIADFIWTGMNPVEKMQVGIASTKVKSETAIRWCGYYGDTFGVNCLLKEHPKRREVGTQFFEQVIENLAERSKLNYGTVSCGEMET